MPFLFMLRVALVATDEGEGLGEFLPADHLARCWCPVGDTERGVGTVWGEASLWKGDHETRCTGLPKFVWSKNSHGFKQRLANPCVSDDRPEAMAGIGPEHRRLLSGRRAEQHSWQDESSSTWEGATWDNPVRLGSVSEVSETLAGRVQS